MQFQHLHHASRNDGKTVPFPIAAGHGLAHAGRATPFHAWPLD